MRPQPGAAQLPTLLQGLHLLVVDDEPDARELVSLALEQAGAQVVAAASAEEAMLALARQVPDLVVSDIGMPREDGYALIRRVRALEPAQGGRVPALALTAYARLEDRTRALAAGFTTHLAKPVEPAELVLVVSSLAGRFAGG